MRGFLEEFRDFVMRGNVLDLAIAVILAVAFGAVIVAFTDGILMAFIAAIFGKPSFDDIVLDIGDGQILIGSFLTACVNFVLVALALFVIIKAVRSMRPDAEEDAGPSEVDLLTEIRDLLRTQPR